MRLCIYAHAFDLDALAGAGGMARLADLGFTEIALATSYHDGRWLMPWHPAGRVRFLEDGTVHFRPRADYGALQPLPSSEVPAAGPSPLERAVAAAGRHGLSVRAWTVFTHNSRLGGRHPGLCVQNAFGDRYRYALCPAQPAVRQYILAMVRDLAAHEGLGAIECEALGAMGWKHSSHHDKASFAPAGLLDAALSACFCEACRARLAAAGHDAGELAAAVRADVDRALAAGDAMAPAKVASGPQDAGAGTARWLPPVLAARAQTIAALAAELVAATPALPRAVQVHPHPWFAGSQLAAPHAAAFPAGDERVLTCYGDGPGAIASALAATVPQLAGAPLRLCIWPKAPQFASDDDLAAVHAACRTHHVEALAVYHLGLLPWRTLERVARSFSA